MFIHVDEWPAFLRAIRSDSSFSGAWKQEYGQEEEWIESLLLSKVLSSLRDSAHPSTQRLFSIFSPVRASIPLDGSAVK